MVVGVVEGAAQLAARVEGLEGEMELLKEASKSDLDAAAAELAGAQEARLLP